MRFFASVKRGVYGVEVHVADGRYGQLLRVQQSAGDDGSSSGTDKVKLTEISVTIPRTLKAESFTSQHF